MMFKRKGLTMTMNIVIAIIVLVILALIVIGVFQGQLFGGLGFLRNRADRQECTANRDIYCQSHPTGCWNATMSTVYKSADDEGTSCGSILRLDEEEGQFSCEYSEYFHTDAYWIFNNTKEYKGLSDEQKEHICKKFGFYWTDDLNKDGTKDDPGCLEDNSDDADEVKLDFIDDLRGKAVQR